MGESMRAMVLERVGHRLRACTVPVPAPGPGQIRIEVSTCGVCRTDLHVIDGELPSPKPLLIPGHEVIGRVDALGPGAEDFRIGERLGVPWLGKTCGACAYCQTSRENLCDFPGFHGYTLDGGYARYMIAESAYCFRIPDRYDDEHAAPLLCAGLIGFRSLRMAGDPHRIGIYGFGAAAHIVTQIAVAEGRRVHAFTQPGDVAAQRLALDVGAVWAGGSDAMPTEQLDAALIFAPVGTLVPTALASVRKGGIVVCGGIHMSDIPAFPYRLIWQERRLVSVANLTRADGVDFMQVAERVPLRVHTTPYPLEDANAALDDLRCGRLAGAAVLHVGSTSR